MAPGPSWQRHLLLHQLQRKASLFSSPLLLLIPKPLPLAVQAAANVDEQEVEEEESEVFHFTAGFLGALPVAGAAAEEQQTLLEGETLQQMLTRMVRHTSKGWVCSSSCFLLLISGPCVSLHCAIECMERVLGQTCNCFLSLACCVC